MTTIVENTNIFATVGYSNRNQNAGATDPDFQTTFAEISAFLGIVLFMGIVKLPRISMYFSRDIRLHQAGVASVFSKHQFFKILKFFHVADPRDMPDEDAPEYKLFRIKPVIDTVSETFTKSYNPHREQSIDEVMVKFKGRLKFLQYMPMKPCKRGIKIWSRCDASNGYLCQFDVYTGKNDEEDNAGAPADQSCPFKGLSARVVYNLTRSLSGKNYMVFMDNVFSGIDLFLKLFEEQIFCCGTVREYRKGFPPALKGVKLANQGDSKFARFQNLVCTVWKDKAKRKNVALLSTQFTPNQFEKVERRKKNPW